MIAVIGQPIDRVDGRLKVTGAARYAADYPAERGRCERASDTLVFRTCMRTLQPTWNHPVG